MHKSSTYKRAVVRKVPGHVAVDLFSGCGGVSLGVRRAGFDVRVAVELAEIPSAAYRNNNPETAILTADVSEVTPSSLMAAAKLKPGELDLLVGCPPCQGFSTLRGPRIPRDSRNTLVHAFGRVAVALRPKVILMENVPRLSQSVYFKRLVTDLETAGYSCSWGILDAADFAVPQRRKRLILIASRIGEIPIPPPLKRNQITLKEAIGDLPHPKYSSDSLHRLYLRPSNRIKQLIRRIPPNGGSRTSLGKRLQLQCHQNSDGFRDIYGRMAWDKVAPTLTTGCFNPSKGRFLHPTQDRPISMREAAILQTFPKAYRFPVERGLIAVARLIGDAFPPKFAEYHARHIAKYLRAHNANPY